MIDDEEGRELNAEARRESEIDRAARTHYSERSPAQERLLALPRGPWCCEKGEAQRKTVCDDCAAQEPVAWMDKRGSMVLFSQKQHCSTDVPLYLHPAPSPEDTKMLDWLDKVCSEGNGRHLCCLPGGLRAAIATAMKGEKG